MKLAFALFAVAAITTAAPTQKSAIKVLVDGEQIEFREARPQSVAGRTLVPMRGIFEALGANVEWNKELRKITARKDNTVIELTIDEKIGKKNGAEIQMDVAPVIRSKSTLVPLRFVAEALDARVEFDKPSLTIRIDTGAGAPAPTESTTGGGSGR